MMRHFIFVLLAIAAAQPALAATLRVPQDHKTIQAAIDSSQPGDTITVAPGKYLDRIRLKPGIILRSDGDDARGTDGFKRAEATIIDGGGKEGKQPGVIMAEGSTLDGFTITNVGAYDEATWKKHFDSQGEELGDEEGSVQAVNASKATVVVTGNSIKGFQGTAIIVKDSQKPAHVYGNTAISTDPKAKLVDVQGPPGVVDENVLKKE